MSTCRRAAPSPGVCHLQLALAVEQVLFHLGVGRLVLRAAGAQGGRCEATATRGQGSVGLAGASQHLPKCNTCPCAPWHHRPTAAASCGRRAPAAASAQSPFAGSEHPAPSAGAAACLQDGAWEAETPTGDVKQLETASAAHHLHSLARSACIACATPTKWQAGLSRQLLCT